MKSGVFLEIDETGRIEGIYFCCDHDDQAEQIRRTLSLIMKPSVYYRVHLMLKSLVKRFLMLGLNYQTLPVSFVTWAFRKFNLGGA